MRNLCVLLTHLVAFVSGVAVLSLCCGAARAADPAELARVVEGNTQFAVDLYAMLAKADGNLFFSPESVSIALAMTYGGARGRTREEMREVLGFPADDEALHACFQTLLQGLSVGKSGEAGYKLSIANRLWGQEDFPFLEAFVKLTRQHYGAELARVDFRSNAEGVRRTINAWVADETEDKIQELLQPGVIDEITRLVLTNAVYFKGDWADRFDKQATKKAPFFVTPENAVDVPMMYQSREFGYGETEALQVLELPYEGKALSMLVLLPKERDGLAALEQALSVDNLAAWSQALRRQKVKVYLPKFKLEAQFELNKTLMAMGMVEAFTGRADFSGMVDATKTAERLFISNVIHKAYVDVNEEGTEAAAATAVVMKLTATAMPRPVPVFRADHPFIFMIRDTRSGSILFLGRMVNPA